MKASLSAFIFAIRDFIADGGFRGSIAVLLTSDEEGDATDGTFKVVDMLAKREEFIDFCIVGEPTSEDALGDVVKIGRRGSLSARLVVHGVQGHVAYPQHAANPVHLAAPAIAELAQIEWDEGTSVFPPTSWHVSNVKAGTGALNVIPGDFQIHLNFRFSPASSPDSLKERVHSILDRHGLSYTIDWRLAAHPYQSTEGQLLKAVCDSITERLGRTPLVSTGGGTSDGRFIARICREVVEFGPVNATIHQLNEHVLVSDVLTLTAIYRGTMERLLRP